MLTGNAGVEADLAANAETVESGSGLSNSAYRMDGGSSIATAYVSAAVALMKLNKPNATALEIRSCLQLEAESLDRINPNFRGKLGAGKLNIKASIDCIKSSNTQKKLITQVKGVLLHSNIERKKVELVWRLQPIGEYKEVRLKPIFDGKNKRVKVNIYANNASKDLIWSGNANDFPSELNAPFSDVTIELSSKSKRAYKFGMHFTFEAVDLAKKYCHGRLDVTTLLTISDGSTDANYSNFSNCEWLVTPPKGHDVVLTFTKLDTQLNTDIVHLFAGSEKIRKNLLLKLSGNEVPQPLRLTNSAPALLWFLSDASIAGNGFEVDVQFVPH